MANEKNDICSIVKKCKILLLDIEGTTTSISFVKDKLFPYAEENVKEFLNSEWETENVKECVIALRKLALEDEENKVDGVVAIPGEDASKEDQIESLVKSVKWQMSSDRKVGPLKQLQGLIWKKGYDKGDIKGHVYEDVLPALELWRSVEGQKVYIYSSGSVQAQKLLFGLSSAGDMLKLIDGHFDTAVGAKQESSSYTTIVEKIGCNPEDILFLTDIDKEAEAARSAGVQAALVSREGNAPLDESVTSCYPVLYSFAELAVTNKRKPDVQEEQPTKVLKTDVEADVKTESETGLKDNSEKPDETEKMEVEEEPVVKSVLPTEKTTENVIEKIETTVEEVTEANKVVDMPICDAEPIIDENPKKTEEKETETMETETAETVSPVSAVLEPEENNECKNGDGDAPVSNESPPAVITEIKDITNDKESLDDVVEMIDDLVPVVEEPPTEDMEDLQNVGEVLEKECDEILSKVQDVTNLDNIPLKPLLNTITEEAMETENTDSNDIVDRILDTELELEMKQCADNDLNIAQEIEKPKELIEKQEDVLNNEIPAAVDEENATKGIEEEKKKKIEESSLTAAKEECSLSEDKNTENSAAEETTDKILTEVKIGESSPTEEKKLESSLSEQKIEENITQEPQNLTSSAGEPFEKVNLTDKQGVEVSATNKIEANETEHTAEERSSPPVKDSITTAEIVKEISAESKIDEIEVVLDEKNKKSEAENANDNMETDVSTTKIDDIASTAEVNTSESNLNTQEKDLEIREAATDTTIEVLEKSSEKDSLETVQTETGTETKDCDKITTDDVVSENATKESQVNGKTTNGDADMVNLNGDSSKDEELSSRLSMENGQEVVNGANGDSTVVEKNTNENNGDDLKDVADMKVKTVVVDEPRNDPIEQPMEA